MAYEKFITKVKGEDRGKMFLFTLSTCIWCRKTKDLLKTLGIAYEYVDVDLIEDDEAAKESVMEDLHKFNPATSFPTIVYKDGERVILGFDEEEIKDCITK